MMARTKKRALPSGKIPVRNAIIYATILAIAGFFILSYTNWLTVAVIGAGFVSYVVVYGFAKRHTLHSTLIGTVPGAASLVAGYTAVMDRLDSTAWVLFLIMLAWQMVHFYAIAIYRFKDYAAGNIPVMPLKVGIFYTKLQMLFYLVIFIVGSILLTLDGRAGYIYLVVMTLLGLVWLQKVIGGFKAVNSETWARDVFKFSLVVVVVFSVVLSLGSVLP